MTKYRLGDEPRAFSYQDNGNKKERITTPDNCAH